MLYSKTYSLEEEEIIQQKFAKSLIELADTLKQQKEIKLNQDTTQTKEI